MFRFPFSAETLSTTNHPVAPPIPIFKEGYENEFSRRDEDTYKIYREESSKTVDILPTERQEENRVLTNVKNPNADIIHRPVLAPIPDKQSSFRINDIDRIAKAKSLCQNLNRKPGVHSVIAIRAAGFEYVNAGGAVRCNICQLEVKELSADVDPFSIHKKLRPNCEYVKSVMKDIEPLILTPENLPVTSTTQTTKSISEHEIPSKRQRLEPNAETKCTPVFREVDIVKQIRRRTFSHWPHRSSPSKSQMIDAGFFSCSVGDRAICIYCHLICQQWTPHTDDPSEIHKELSPNCIFVKHMLIREDVTPIAIINQQTSGNNGGQATTGILRSSDIVVAAASNPYYMEIPKRHQSFNTWQSDSLPPVDDLVRAGFFYTGTGTIVTCFYCNGSLQNWGATDNPVVEHARWFPQCQYAKQLCGEDLYRKIQESKRIAQERAKAKEPNNGVSGTAAKLQISDESTLSRFVASRLDLSVSQRLINQNFKLSIIKRCWEDQLRIKLDDFIDDCDLLMACIVLDKQISCINGKKENIIIPSVKMRQIRGERDSGTTNEMDAGSRSNTTASNNRAYNQTNTNGKTSANVNASSTQPNNEDASNPCVLCMTEERALACIPCGHLATCVPCGHSLKLCPMCRQKIDGYVRVYI